MEDETTTSAPVADGGTIQGIPVDSDGQAVPQPETTETPEAVQEPSPEAKPEEPSSDDTSEWLKKKGIDVNDPEAITKLAKSAREAERAMHAKAQKASELEKTIESKADEYAEQTALETGQDPELLKRVQRVEVQSTVRDFFAENPEAKESEQAMIAELQQRPYLAGDLDALYKVVKASDLESVKSQASKDTLTKLAQNQQAAVPTGNAVNSSNMGEAAITPQNVDQLVGSHDSAWFEKNYEAINKAMAQ
jgi:hypothetical protein